MDVLVTGGCGYIGSALVPRLCEDDRVDSVAVLDSLDSGSPGALAGSLGGSPHCSLAFQRGDVREYGDVESATRDVDTVVHLAAITGAASTHDRREETFAVNYGGTENVLKAASKFGVDNVVLASSCNVYGRATSTDIDETTDPDPINPYAEAKFECESLLREYCEGRNEGGSDGSGATDGDDSRAADGDDSRAADGDGTMQGTALRMSTNYGYAPGIRFNLVVNYFVFRALTGRALTVYGDGSNWRPFIHVEDAARAYKHAALEPERWDEYVYNVGANVDNFQIAEIASVVREKVGPVDITYLEDEHPGPSYHVNFDRLAETGFEPKWTLREGVQDLKRHLTGGPGASADEGTSNGAGAIDD